jgi:hypothetical protein
MVGAPAAALVAGHQIVDGAGCQRQFGGGGQLGKGVERASQRRSVQHRPHQTAPVAVLLLQLADALADAVRR